MAVFKVEENTEGNLHIDVTWFGTRQLICVLYCACGHFCTFLIHVTACCACSNRVPRYWCVIYKGGTKRAEASHS